MYIHVAHLQIKGLENVPHIYQSKTELKVSQTLGHLNIKVTKEGGLLTVMDGKWNVMIILCEAVWRWLQNKYELTRFKGDTHYSSSPTYGVLQCIYWCIMLAWFCYRNIAHID